ncbi:MAG: aldo/keto reductase [Treponema sp.]|nr:aldo/keto reductase [Treponema sp.]
MEYVNLRNGVQFPLIGLGTWQITDRSLLLSVLDNAFKVGYSFIDTAAAYSNELSIGTTISRLGVPRSKLFLQTKVWNTSRGFWEVQTACRTSLKKLKLDYIDSYLVHWPASPKLHENWQELNAETWRGMERLFEDGLVRSIGVCNFKFHHLEALVETCSILPMTLQAELHPGLSSPSLSKTLTWCNKNNVAIQASSPLGNGQILQNNEILGISAAHAKSAAQVCIRYSIQKGFAAIPKTAHPARLKENISVFDFELTAQEMHQLDELPFCGGLQLDSDEVTQFG